MDGFKLIWSHILYSSDIRHQKTKPMFQKHMKDHKMKLRNKNEFKETKTKTNRLQKSSIFLHGKTTK